MEYRQQHIVEYEKQHSTIQRQASLFQTISEEHGGRYGTAGERRVVSAAVLSVEHKAEVEQVSFLGSVGTVVAQGGKNALCKALVLVYLVHYH